MEELSSGCEGLPFTGSVLQAEEILSQKKVVDGGVWATATEHAITQSAS